MGSDSLTESLRETLALFDESGEPWSTTEIADRLGLGRRSTYERLERLVERDRLATKKVGANARVWWRAPTAASSEGPSADRAKTQAEFEALVTAVEEYAIFTLDPEGIVQTWNPGVKRIKGYDADEIVGQHFSTFYTEADRADRVPERNLAHAARDGSVEDENWRVRRDGSLFWANVTITAIRDETGTLEGFAKVTRDMTERREYEQQLRDERAFIESLLDNQQDLFYAFDVDEGLIRWNDRVPEVTGYTEAELSQLGPADLIADSATEKLEAVIDQLFETGESPTVELPLETADGEVIPYEFSGGPIRDEDGTVRGFTGLGRDISDRKARERQLRRQRDDLQAELEDIFTRIDEAFLALDEQGRCVYVNDRAESLLEVSAEELLGKPSLEAVPAFTEAYPRETLEASMQTQEVVEFEFYSSVVDRWLEVRGYPSESGISIYVRDISERKEYERGLEESRRRTQTLVEHFPNGVVALVDENLRYLTVGGTPPAAISATVDDIEGRTVGEVLPGGADDRLVAAYEAAFDGETTTFEQTLGEDVFVFRVVPIRDDAGEIFTALGMSQDITEAVERERELETRLRQQEVVSRFGQRALVERDIDALMHEASQLVADTLGTDYCTVLELDTEAEELLVRQGVGWQEGVVGSATVSAVDADSLASYTLAADGPVVVSDLETDTRFSGPELLTSHDVRGGISTILGSPDEPWGILGTHDRAHREFDDQDANFVQSIANTLSTAISRHEREQELLHQREQLAALNDLNQVAREIVDEVIEQSTREEIETTVCERLVESHSYLFAWVGEIDATTQTVTVRTEVGVEGYLDETTISIDPDDDRSMGPTASAFLTGETQVLQAIHDAPAYEPWREVPAEYGFQSSAAIPITYENSVYGVLNVYSDRPYAFEGEEREVISQLGEVMGHAIAAASHKRALMSDEAVELELRLRNVFEGFDVPVDPAGTITFDHVVPVGSDAFVVYGTATDEAVESVRALVETLPHWEAVQFRSEGDPVRFELQLSEPPILSIVAAYGGSLERAVIEGGNYTMRLRFGLDVDVRQVTDAFAEAYPTIELLSRREVSQRAESDGDRQGDPLVALTDRQQTALDLAVHSGFFEWPREVTGEELAATMDIAPATFHQHLRGAEKKLLSSVFPQSNSD